MKFFSLGAGELLLILLFAIIAVGPKEALRLVGQARDIVSTVRGAISELTSEISRAASEITELSEETDKK